MEERVRNLISEYERYTKENGFSLNPDRKVVETLVTALISNEEKRGRRYCPCMPVTGNDNIDCKNVCPCTRHKEDVEKDGRCHCGLFVKLP